MVDPVTYDFLKTCLYKFDYPNIHSKTGLEVSDILLSHNRFFLIKWFFKKVGTKSEEFLDSLNMEGFEELVHCYGFCEESEKDGFMNCCLPVQRQADILHSMFSYLCQLQDNPLAPGNGRPISHIEPLPYMQSLETNLFPTYGPKRTLTPAERLKKYQEYMRDMEYYQQFCDQHAKASEFGLATFMERSDYLLDNALEHFEGHFAEFKKKCFAEIDFTLDLHGQPCEQGLFNSQAGELIGRCQHTANLILEYMKCLNVVKQDGNGSGAVVENPDENKEESMMKSLASLCLNKEPQD